MITREEIDQILATHTAWKAHFRDYLAGRAALDATIVSDAEQCQLGAWLIGYGPKYLRQEQLIELDSLHKEFHRVAADILYRIKTQDFDGARFAIASEGTLEQASAALANKLLLLKNGL